MGGTGSISDGVVSALAAYAPTVTRVSGADRYATAVSLSAATTASGVSRVYLASGTSFPDGLAAGPIAGMRGAPLLLVPPDYVPSSVASELERLNPGAVVVVGGTGVIGDAVKGQTQALLQ
jgi:putative cell wall-binding protein